jgi:hypothetical protein
MSSSTSTPPPPPVTAQVQVANTVTGPFNLAMSTSFQPDEWDYQFFTNNPGATTLGNLLPQHIRLQAVSEGVPHGAADSTSTAWNFNILDAITQPVLSVGDHSPEFQIAKAPPFMYAGDDSGNDFTDPTFQEFAGFAQNLVQYYNTGGFTANGQTYLSASYPTDKIAWWGIYNEPNINNNLTPQQYVTMYNSGASDATLTHGSFCQKAQEPVESCPGTAPPGANATLRLLSEIVLKDAQRISVLPGS